MMMSSRLRLPPQLRGGLTAVEFSMRAPLILQTDFIAIFSDNLVIHFLRSTPHRKSAKPSRIKRSYVVISIVRMEPVLTGRYLVW